MTFEELKAKALKYRPTMSDAEMAVLWERHQRAQKVQDDKEKRKKK